MSDKLVDAFEKTLFVVMLIVYGMAFIGGMHHFMMMIGVFK